MTPAEAKSLPTLEIDPKLITIGDRIGGESRLEDLDELEESMTNPEIGQIVPIIIDLNMRLIDGGRRLTVALRNNWPTIRYVYREVLSETHLRILEVDANKHKRFNWRESCLAIDRIHNAYSLEKALIGQQWTLKATAKLLGYDGESNILNALQVARELKKNDPAFDKCESLRDAQRILLERKENLLNARLINLTMPKNGGLDLLNKPLTSPRPALPRSSSATESDFFAGGEVGGYTPGVGGPVDTGEMPGAVSTVTPTIPLSQMLLQESSGHKSLAIFASLYKESLDHIISDPPYAINLGMIQQKDDRFSPVENTRAEHDEEDNFKMLERFIPLAYDRLKPGGFCILFYDYMMWDSLYTWGLAAGFKVQRWPLIWHKTHTCLNQAAQANFTKNHEPAIVMRKTSATLISPQTSSVWSGSADAECKALGHPFAKPFGLWKWLYSATTIRGQTVCDPFAGRGSSTLAAIQSGLRPLAIECNTDHYNHLVINCQNQYKSLVPDCIFT